MSSKSECTVTGEQNQKGGLKPKLRFPEYRDAGDWKEKLLKAVCKVNPSNMGLPESFFYIDLGSVEDGKLITANRISRDGAPSRAQRLLKKGDVLFQTVRPYQKNNLLFNIDGNDFVASTGYAQLRANGPETFLYQIVHTDNFVTKVIAKCTGSSYPAINSSDLAEIPLLVPGLPEQQKIADCLSSTDALIAAEADKLEALKDHKKGLMQQLFPAPGETTPHLRFPEFQGAADWKERPLGEIASYQNGKAYESHIVEEGRYIVVNARFISTEGGVKKWSNNPLLIAEADDILMVLSDLPNGRALAKCYRVRDDNKYAVNQRIARLTPHAVRSDFLLPVLNRHPNLLSFNDGMNQTHLSKGDVLTCPILLPTSEEEQAAIADCLGSVDALIAAHVNSISALKAHKSGLMQQLFPIPAKASA